MPMKPFDAFDEDVATEIAGFLANEIEALNSFSVAEEECQMRAATFGFHGEVCVLTLVRTTFEGRRYRVTIEREE